MYLRALYLHHFRSYKEALYEFSPNINVIMGPNASGKTSILEAVYFLMTGRSFRATHTQDMIHHGTAGFYLEAHFIKYDVTHILRIHCTGKEKKISYNNAHCNSFSSLFGLILGTVMHPDDADIVKGAPEVRRHLLDLQIAQTDPLYVHHLTRYHRAMKQRNYLLRNKITTAIESWEYEMANAAAYLVSQRAKTIVELKKEGQYIHSLITHSNDLLELAYKSSSMSRSQQISEESLPQLRTHYLEQFHKLRGRELELGTTLIGPHKDDVFIGLNSNEARFFSSEGQQRSCVAAIRLAEWARLKALSQEVPLLLVDDIGMSLDLSRRTHLFSHFSSLGQVFLTTTEELQLGANAQIINLTPIL